MYSSILLLRLRLKNKHCGLQAFSPSNWKGQKLTRNKSLGQYEGPSFIQNSNMYGPFSPTAFLVKRFLQNAVFLLLL